MKHALAPLAVLVALTATACGSDDETTDAAAEPTTSSSSAAGEPGSDAAFCTALVGNGALEDGSDVEELEAGLTASGIPDDAPQDATKGFDVYLDILADIDADASAEDLAAMDDFDLSTAQQNQMNALVQYAGATCAETAVPEDGADEGAEEGAEESAPAEGEEQDDSSQE